MKDEIVIGNEKELFFDKESKKATREVTYDSSDDRVVVLYFSGKHKEKISYHIVCTKEEFLELKNFIKNIRITKNYKLK